MVQQTKLVNPETATEYTFDSTTNAVEITVSDDKFAEVIAIKKLTEAINDLARAVRNR